MKMFTVLVLSYVLMLSFGCGDSVSEPLTQDVQDESWAYDYDDVAFNDSESGVDVISEVQVEVAQECDYEMCDDDNYCTDDYCMKNGKCLNVPKFNYTQCDIDGSVCIDGQCLSDEEEIPCQSDYSCDDSRECTIDTCLVSGQCVYDYKLNYIPCHDGAGQCWNGECVADTGLASCSSDDFCDDGDSSTIDKCVCKGAGCTCTHIHGCLSDLDCIVSPDGQYCEFDLYNEFGRCQPCLQDDYNTGCHLEELCWKDKTNSSQLNWCAECFSDQDCDDDNGCTQDQCVTNIDDNYAYCEHTYCDDEQYCDLSKAQCFGKECESDEDCEDGDLYTYNVCLSYKCQKTKIECLTADNCPVSDDPCQKAECFPYGVCKYINICDCTDSLNCDDSNPCTVDTCEDGLCQNFSNGTCSLESTGCLYDSTCSMYHDSFQTECIDFECVHFKKNYQCNTDMDCSGFCYSAGCYNTYFVEYEIDNISVADDSPYGAQSVNQQSIIAKFDYTMISDYNLSENMIAFSGKYMIDMVFNHITDWKMFDEYGEISTGKVDFAKKVVVFSGDLSDFGGLQEYSWTITANTLNLKGSGSSVTLSFDNPNGEELNSPPLIFD